MNAFITFIAIAVLVTLGVVGYRRVIRKDAPTPPGPVPPPPAPRIPSFPSYEPVFEQCSGEIKSGDQIWYDSLFRVYLGTTAELAPTQKVQVNVSWKTRGGEELLTLDSDIVAVSTLRNVSGVYYYQPAAPISIQTNTTQIELIAYVSVKILDANSVLISSMRDFTQDVILYCVEHTN